MARFKKRKSDIIIDAKIAAERAVINEFELLKSKTRYGGYVSQEDLLKYPNLSIQDNMMLKAISTAIEAAVQEVVDNIYTDEEFEQDIGLRS